MGRKKNQNIAWMLIPDSVIVQIRKVLCLSKSKFCLIRKRSLTFTSTSSSNQDSTTANHHPRTVWIHQPSDCLLMIAWFTKRSTLITTPKTSKQTSMHCRPGSVGGWWVFIPRSVNYYESHGSRLQSSPSTTSTGMYWRWLTQQSTLEWLSTITVHGRNTSARQPGRPITLMPSSRGISAEHQHRLRNGPTRLSLGPFWNTLSLSGTHTLNQTFTGWRWCNAGMLDTHATTSAAPVASLLCSSRSVGRLYRNEEPSPVWRCNVASPTI